MKPLIYTTLFYLATFSALSQVKFTGHLNETQSQGNKTGHLKVIEGQATWYNNKSVGITPANPVKKTANGDRFDETKMTAAVARKFYDKLVGKQVKVTNLKNNKTVRVTINDKMGVNSKYPRLIIDLTQAAAAKLDMIRDGRVEVKVEVMD